MEENKIELRYTIGQVSEMFDLPISTLRYYDKEGLFPYLERKSGVRKFSERELEAIRVIECLKISGLEIKDIKQFMAWCTEGSKTYKNRKALFEKRKEAVEKELKGLQKTLDMLKFKCWYYETAIKDGNEDNLNRMIPDNLPKDIKKLYHNAHN
ncbi:MAG: MerR family transcriptional regulator [Clostridia bacterium]|nr:MerR family transcriptional regulator [Clostridia bacterium]